MDVNVTPGFPLTGIDKEAAEKSIGDTTGMSDQEIKDAILKYMANRPTNSAGRIVRDKQQGRVESSTTQNPQPLVEEWMQEAYGGSDDYYSNLTQNTKTGRLTPNNTPLPIKNDAGSNLSDTNVDGPGTSNLGTGIQSKSNKEENITITDGDKTDSKVKIASEFKQNIETKENPFKKFGSYTYSVSVYILGHQEYAEMLSSGKKSVNGYTLLMQSAGINNEATIDNNVHQFAKRSKFFPLDFYIDDIEFKGLISGHSTQSPHNEFALSFKVTEPNGLSFLDNLYHAIQEYNADKKISNQEINYAAQNFLMVVRFYGYDQEGNAVSGKDLQLNNNTSDTNAVSEKWIPFQFTGIQFAIRNELVEYKCEAVCPQSQIPYDVNAKLPFNVELSGQTLTELLKGKPTIEPENYAYDADAETNLLDEAYETNPINPTLTTGLIEAINNHQIKLATPKNQGGEGIYEFPNVYTLEFEKDSGLASATVASRTNGGEFTDKSRTALHNRKKAQNYLNKHQSVDINNKLFAINAGTPISKILDLMVRTSSYITDQASVVYDEVKGTYKPKQSEKIFQWYKIRTQVKPYVYDKKRGDYAYKVSYIISRYQVNNTESGYFPIANQYRGVHKAYDYWFTGKNTEVIDFEQDYNYLYFQTMGKSMLNPPRLQHNARNATKRFYEPGTAESSHGTKGGRGNASANAASILYSPSDTAKAKMTISGDPDWFAQSEVFYSPGKSITDVGLGPWMQDGSVNYDASEILFSINYNTNQDYNLMNGIAEVGKDNYGRNIGSGIPGESRISLVYQATTITTNLSSGKFTQSIEGVFRQFPPIETIDREKEEIRMYAKLAAERDLISDDGGYTAGESFVWEDKTYVVPEPERDE